MNRSRLAALSAGAMFLVATVLVPATALAAGSGSLSVSPSTVTTTTGSTFTVDINSQADTAMSGASAAVVFDNTKLQIISVAKGAGWNTVDTSWVFPTVANIATANATGTLNSIAAYFTDGSSSLPAATSTPLATVTFFATAAGTATISLPVGGNQGAILDGTPATYGSAVAVTSTGAEVTIASGTNPNGPITTNINGLVDAGYLTLTCPASVDVPLVRNVVNTKDFTCQVGSNVTWTLSTQDNNLDPNRGHMTDTAQVPTAVLADSLHVLYDAQLSDVNLEGAGLQPLATGQNNISLPLVFAQNVRPADKPGAYGMSVLFSITSTF